MQIKEKIKTISDLAFIAVDADNSNSLDSDELAAIMKEVAKEMRVTAPTQNDIKTVLSELDEDESGCVSKDEFF